MGSFGRLCCSPLGMASAVGCADVCDTSAGVMAGGPDMFDEVQGMDSLQQQTRTARSYIPAEALDKDPASTLRL